MPYRRDPVQGATAILRRLFELATEHAPHARVTVGNLQAEPGVINTVPGRLTFTVDLRHPEATTLTEMDIGLKAIVQEECGSANLDGTVENVWYSPPVVFADQCIRSIRKAVSTLDLASLDMVSGAGHDAVYVSHVAPTGMIFVPCKEGLSHNELESVKPEEAAAGATVLLHAMLDQAN
jgi:N-carbamoyl-L-amino-acid hydrolase